MADPRTTLPTAATGTGTPIEAVTVAGGAAVPTTGLRAFNSSGQLVDVQVDSTGRLIVAPLDQLPSSLVTIGPNTRLRVSTTLSDQATVSAALGTTAGVHGVGSQVFAAVPGMSAVAIRVATIAATTATLQFEWTLADDPNTTVAADWMPLNVVRQDTYAITNPFVLSATTGTWTHQASLPPGATAVRVRRSAGTISTPTINIAASAQPTVPLVTLSGGVAQPITGTVSANSTAVASVVKVGAVSAAAMWFDDTATVLAASATYTGTSRDTTAAVTGNQATAATTYAKEIRGLAVSDVAGVLYLEVSRDNTTWRRIMQVPTVQTIAGGLFVAEAQMLPATRYMRWVFVNGAALQTHFMLQTMMLSG